MLDFSATWPHYVDHVAPIWHALEPERLGTFAANPRPLAGTSATQRAKELGIPTARHLPRKDTPCLVPGWSDLLAVGRRPLVWLEHGAGQTYIGQKWASPDHPAFGRVGLFLVPSERVADHYRAHHPAARYAAVGCPRLDRWLGWRPANRVPVVAVTSHWTDTSRQIPEISGAWPEYRRAFLALADQGRGRFEVIGHGHPKEQAKLRPLWEEAGVEFVADWEAVLERADLLVGDNTSALFEFAATGRPVVVVNASTYRRDVHHGLRFWECSTVGLNVWTPGALYLGVLGGLEDPKVTQRERRRVSTTVYAHLDGSATAAAVQAITGWLP